MGKGSLIENPCRSCSGSGRVRKKRKLSVISQEELMKEQE